MTTVAKTTVRIDESEAADVARMKKRDSLEAAAFRDLTGIEASSAALATILHVLVEAGIDAVRQRAEQIGYERLTEFLRTDPEHQAWRESRRTRPRLTENM